MTKPEEFRLSAAALRRDLDALAAADADVARTLAEIGYPAERRRRPGFEALLRIAVAQQVSAKAAAAIFGRLEAAMGGAPAAERFLALDDAALRQIGLSRQKIAYGRGLAEAVVGGALDVEALATLDDAAVIEAVTALKGFGVWSARMYLMFALGRPDIWPADDLGVREGVRRIRRLESRPGVAETETLGAVWAPRRSAATLLCWHVLHNAPA